MGRISRLDLLKEHACQVGTKRTYRQIEQEAEDLLQITRLRQTGSRLNAVKAKPARKPVLERVLGLFNSMFQQKHKLLSARAEEIRARAKWTGEERQDANTRLSCAKFSTLSWD